MKIEIGILYTLVACLAFGRTNGQASMPFKYGQVSVADFDNSGLHVDTTKGAIIVYDFGVTTFGSKSKPFYQLVFKRKSRIHIINKNGIEAATLSFGIFGGSERNRKKVIEDLEASTYNLVDGKVIENKLSSDAIYNDKLAKNFTNKKLTLAAVKEGSIIEYSYTLNADLNNLQPWLFQAAYPTVWSECEIDLPDFFEYLILKQGYLPIDIYEHPTHREFFTSMMDAAVTNHRWIMKNVPALTEEKYVTNIINHIAKLEFQFSASRVNGAYRSYLSNWVIFHRIVKY